MLAIGLMSGTSLDGLDIALCEIEGSYFDTKVKLIDFVCIDMPDLLRNKIKLACDEKLSNNKLICSLGFELGYFYLDGINFCLKKNNLNYDDISYIASHGQTIYHLPAPEKGFYASTLQIGQPAILAYNTGITIVSDFRVMDIAAKGQGAPLVSYVDYILYSDKNYNIALQNIGGIANVTFLSNSLLIDDVIAFDNGPGNMMINEAMKIFYDKEYDAGGLVAQSGSLCQDLFLELANHNFLKKDIPKTTGREDFGQDYVKYLVTKYSNVDSKDIIHTFTYFTSFSIVDSYKRFLKFIPDKVIASGGGVYNNFMMETMQKMLNNQCCFLTQEMLGLNSDAKEAVAFVVLGNETLRGVCNNVPSATGANKRVVLGNITGLKRGIL